MSGASPEGPRSSDAGRDGSAGRGDAVGSRGSEPRAGAVVGREECSFAIYQRRVGFARYDAAMCRVLCGEGHASLEHVEELPIGTAADIPADLLWFERLLSCVRPRVAIFPSVGCQLLIDIAFLCGVDVLLSPPSEAGAAVALAQLQVFWPQVPLQQWHSRLNVGHTAMMMAVSVMLGFVLRNGWALASIAEVAPWSVLCVDSATIDGLQIMRADEHPCLHQGIGCVKEGLSLFALVDRTCCPMGRLLLRQWCLMPANALGELRERGDVVAFLAQPANGELLRSLRRALRAVWSPGRLFTRILATRHGLGEYERLLKCASGYVALTDLVVPVAHRFPCFGRLVGSCCRDSVAAIAESIRHCVDFDRARAAVNRTQRAGCRSSIPIRSGVDPLLDELRCHYRELDGVLASVAQRTSASLPPQLQHIAVQCGFTPPFGYVVLVALDAVGPRSRASPGDRGEAVELLLCDLSRLPGWTCVHRTAEAAYFKNGDVAALDAGVGDLRLAIADREGVIQRALDQRLLSLSPSLISVSDVAEIDCLCAFAQCAIDYGWTRPELVEEVGILEITDGFHPLLGCVTSSVIPFCFSVNTPRERMCVVTGANGSGKSVLLNAVALIVYLAHLGSFVPCATARVSLLHHLLTCHSGAGAGRAAPAGLAGGGPGYHRGRRRPRVGQGPGGEAVPEAEATAAAAGCQEEALVDDGVAASPGSVQAALGGGPELGSSFGNELARVSRMLRLAEMTPRSLFVLDEFGKGTLTTDGVALLAGSLQHLLSLGDRRPTVLICTHYTDILDDARLLPLTEVQWLQSVTRLIPFAPAAADPRAMGAYADAVDLVGVPAADGELVSLYRFDQITVERLRGELRADGTRRSAWEMQQHGVGIGAYGDVPREVGGGVEAERPGALAGAPLCNALRCALQAAVPWRVVARAQHLLRSSLRRTLQQATTIAEVPASPVAPSAAGD